VKDNAVEAAGRLSDEAGTVAAAHAPYSAAVAVRTS